MSLKKNCATAQAGHRAAILFNLNLLILLPSIIQNPHPARNTQFKSDIFLLPSSTNFIFLSSTAHFSSPEQCYIHFCFQHCPFLFFQAVLHSFLLLALPISLLQGSTSSLLFSSTACPHKTLHKKQLSCDNCYVTFSIQLEKDRQ